MLHTIKIFFWAFLLLITKQSFTQPQINDSAKRILNQAIIELGKGWDTIRALKLKGYGTSFIIDQSERFSALSPIGSANDLVMRHLRG